jgi:hypothetical protein
MGLDPIIEQGQAQIPLPLEARGEPPCKVSSPGWNSPGLSYLETTSAGYDLLAVVAAELHQFLF